MEITDFILVVVLVGGPYGLAIWALVIEVRRTHQ